MYPSTYLPELPHVFYYLCQFDNAASGVRHVFASSNNAEVAVG